MKNKKTISNANPEYVIAPLGFVGSIIESAYPNLEHHKTLPDDAKRMNEPVAIILNFPKIKK